METLEIKIQAKKQRLQEVLCYALNQTPVYLPVIKQLKAEILVCDYALEQLNFRRAETRLG